MKRTLCLIFEWLRWIVIIIALQIGYVNFQSIAGVFPLISFLTVFTIAGLSGTESLFLSEEAQKLTGYKPSGYQRQCGLFFYKFSKSMAVRAKRGSILLKHYLKKHNNEQEINPDSF